METMATPDPSENPPPPPLDRKAAMMVLKRGREFATRLAALLLQKNSESSVSGEEAAELAGEVARCFSTALPVLEFAGESPEVSQVDPTTGVGLPCSDDRRSKNCAAAGMKKIRPASSGDRRGGLRRRSHPYERSTVISTTIDDNYTWRKYGQKEIHSAKFPRSYYRCTHKHDQGCEASRQVQKSESDPSLFLITYMGHHTCIRNRSIRGAVPVGLTDHTPQPSSLISFEPSDTSDGGERQPGIQPSPPFAAAAVDPEPEFFAADEADELSNVSRHDSSSEYLTLPDIADLSGVPAEAAPDISAAAAAVSDVGDVTSALSSGSLQAMEFMSDPFDFVVFDFNQPLDFNFD